MFSFSAGSLGQGTGISKKYQKTKVFCRVMEEVQSVQRKKILSSDFSFTDCVNTERTPIVFENIPIGDAVSKWNEVYLADIIGDVPVKVHVSPVEKLDFLKKNFVYKTLQFKDFLKRVSIDLQKEFFICEKEKYYLRSLGNDNRKDVSDIKVQYPKLKNDIVFPPFFNEKQYFSSVFRISSAGTQLWTHYDIMDNILIHIKGHKRVVLFPPTDTLNLYLSGDKSTIIDIDNPDNDLYPKFKNVTRYECILNPGDVLFIPALWFHNITALDFSISVNVFWKHLDEKLYDSKDVYGNKDLIPSQRAFQGVDKALKALNELPKEYSNFYKLRLISHIEKSLE